MHILTIMLKHSGFCGILHVFYVEIQNGEHFVLHMTWEVPLFNINSLNIQALP